MTDIDMFLTIAGAIIGTGIMGVIFLMFGS